MLTGLNHLTLAVTDLDRSVAFYTALPGVRLRARWLRGAYLSVGTCWLCLTRSSLPLESASVQYTHYAFSLSQEDFLPMVNILESKQVPTWQENRSEGSSWYFLDPDGHKLEVHVGDLESRLAQCRLHPYEGMQFYD